MTTAPPGEQCQRRRMPPPAGLFISDISNGDGTRTRRTTAAISPTRSRASARSARRAAASSRRCSPFCARSTAPNPANAGFLRPDADLAIVILTDEDDCSAIDPAIFERRDYGQRAQRLRLPAAVRNTTAISRSRRAAARRTPIVARIRATVLDIGAPQTCSPDQRSSQTLGAGDRRQAGDGRGPTTRVGWSRARSGATPSCSATISSSRRWRDPRSGCRHSPVTTSRTRSIPPASPTTVTRSPTLDPR